MHMHAHAHTRTRVRTHAHAFPSETVGFLRHSSPEAQLWHQLLQALPLTNPKPSFHSTFKGPPPNTYRTNLVTGFCVHDHRGGLYQNIITASEGTMLHSFFGS